jgi:hypothetical protein
MKYQFRIQLLLILIFGINSCCLQESDVVTFQAEARANSSYMQWAIDEYRKEYGEYPPFLLGGDKEGWDYYNAHRPQGSPFRYDPLLSAGIMTSYPANPFNEASKWAERADRKAFDEFKLLIEGANGDLFDPRFGLNGDKMGNALMEPFIFIGRGDRKSEYYPRMCPGQFYYKGFGASGLKRELKSLEEKLPLENYHDKPYKGYVLGVFGSVETTGLDTIRWLDMSGNLSEEFPYVSETDYYSNIEGLNLAVKLQLPEVLGGGGPNTPPFWPPFNYYKVKGYAHTWYARKILLEAPDGIPDGVIKVRVGGDDLS